jgi:hypothetical protein
MDDGIVLLSYEFLLWRNKLYINMTNKIWGVN